MLQHPSTRSARPARLLALAGAVALAGSLAACGHNRPAPQYAGGGYQTSVPAAYPQQPVGTEYGRVSHIETLQGRAPGQTSGAGAILGAVVGGVLGNQIGGGTGRAAATAVGVLGGAVAGNAIEGRNSQQQVQGFRLTIQLDQGGYRAYDVASPGDLRIGDRVRMVNGQISRV